MYRFAAIPVVLLTLLAASISPARAGTAAGAGSPSAVLFLIPQDAAEDLGFDEVINDGFARIPELSPALTSSRMRHAASVSGRA